MAFSGEIEKLERRWQENPLGLTFAPLAEAYRKARDPGRALELLKQGLTQHPNYVPAHIVRGRCHLDAQSDADAELAFLRVTELDPENVIALKGLAELSERGGRLPEAILRLEMLLDLDRNNEEARGQLDRVKELHANQPVAPAAEPKPVPQTSVSEVPVPELSAASPQPLEDDSLSDIELEVATQLSASPGSEFQIPNDAEMLRPFGERITDIVLGAESLEEESPRNEAAPAAEAAPADPRADGGMDSVDALLGDEYGSLLAYRDEAMPPARPVEPTAQADSTVFDQLAMIAESPVPVVDVLPPPPPPPFEQVSFLPPPPPAPEPDPAAESVAPPEPDSVPVAEFAESLEHELLGGPAADAEAPSSPPMADGYVSLGDLGEPTPHQPAAPTPQEEREPAAAEEPALVVTETMAEVFLRQGHRELALAVYAQLAQREPDNERIAEALARLTPEAPAAPPPTPEPAPRYAASQTGGRSVGQLFQALLSASRPAVAPTIHPPAFEHPKRPSGEPTRPAQESLSLSSVFGEEAAPAGPAGPPAEGTPGEPSFDEFFAPATGSSADAELPRAPDSGAMPAQVPEDLEQFNAWLRGLKR